MPPFAITVAVASVQKFKNALNCRYLQLVVLASARKFENDLKCRHLQLQWYSKVSAKIQKWFEMPPFLITVVVASAQKFENALKLAL